MRRCLPILAAAGLLAGCGNEPTRPPDVRHADAPGGGQRRVRFKDAGIRFNAPANWQDVQPQGARLGGIQSKTATVAVWRYPRSEPLPVTPTALKEVRDLLVARVKGRDTSFKLESSRITRRGGGPAIELVGHQTMAGLRYDVRSSHVYRNGAEVVVDAYAPPEDFRRVDKTVFRRLLRSLRVSGS